jgi:hypothetical protein
MVALGRLPAEAAKMKKNADRLYRQFKLAEYGCFANLCRNGKDEFIRLSPKVMRDANLKHSKKYSAALEEIGVLYAIGAIPRRVRSLLGINKPMVKAMDSLYGNSSLFLDLYHEFLHAYQIKRKLFPSPKASEFISTLRQSYSVKIEKLMMTRALKIEPQDPLNITSEEVNKIFKIAEKCTQDALPLLKKTTVKELRNLDSETLRHIKLQGLLEFHAIDKSAQQAKKLGIVLKPEDLQETENYRKLHSTLNNWVRMVEKERRLAAAVKT